MDSTKSKPKSGKKALNILLPFVLPLGLIVMGILLLANETLFNKIFIALGILIALIGLVEVVIYAARRDFQPETRYLVTGIILMAVGALLIIVPFTVNQLIPILIGLCILISGISGIANTMAFRKNDSGILIPMLFAITNVLLGIFILVYVLFVNHDAGWNVIGILMIISGVLRIINEIAARLAPKQAGSVVETTAEPSNRD